MIASTYINTKLKPGARQIEPGAFFGHYTPAPEQSDDQMLAQMKAWSAAHNERLKG